LVIWHRKAQEGVIRALQARPAHSQRHTERSAAERHQWSRFGSHAQNVAQMIFQVHVRHKLTNPRENVQTRHGKSGRPFPLPSSAHSRRFALLESITQNLDKLSFSDKISPRIKDGSISL
jgi:hypothetical protein